MVAMILPPQEDTTPSTVHTVDEPWAEAAGEPTLGSEGLATSVPFADTVMTSPDDEEEEDDGGPEWLWPPHRI
ncbi:hypothetical protein JCM3263A_28210 [Thermobifida fusca]|jgi:hypothetical protein|uniref:Uncharacterized protein n=2 Tax=Thermobifida fusca TaxID=2021 RepID=A0A9P2TE79_THEFU|nr:MULTISPECIES: hypothetical protein [Thermobifida]AAZ57120.1 hypothetical protein Tfu_3087 [Thermobifida fusca YX]EOR72831.1 hypothetical protein TM51_00175 [Thermobifida fusca TM51]MBO2528551.1 hypothetical protein [Thermobifida sp.]MDD6793645.1 hypothetical protein [Thermobifida fusca]PPS94271.1 hypothetical protein BH05_06385 [Thermobifida fusca]